MNGSAGGAGRRGALLGGLVYAALAVAVVALVAAATGFRDEIRGADAWEHHRAIRVVAALGPAAGNPTYATDEPSIRYSPYTLALAWLVRHTGWSAWDALGRAAVVNTALLLLALYVLLAAFGERRAAVPTLLVALLLYGVSPAYANTLALDDLPWHMVNPSALAVALCLGSWAAFRWAAPSGRRLVAVAPAVAAALAFALLAHGMSGVLGGVGLAALALAEHGPARRRLLVATAAVGAAAGVLCLAWPYYSFARALLTNPNPGYWYNATILRLMLTQWCLPCLVAALLAVPLRASPVVRFGLWGLGLTGALTVFAVVTRSPTFARLPLAGLVFAQVLTGVVLERWRLVERSSWREILAGLRSTDAAAFVPALVRVLVPALIAYFAAPKIAALAREPHLLRPLLARRLHLRDLQAHWYARYAAILAGVGERDVVMADPDTAWPVPSFHGRIVAAAHFEFFTPGQQRRFDDATQFVAPGTPLEVRRRLLREYGARWILLDETANERVLPELRIASAVVRDEGGLVLVDAQRWLAAAAGTTAGR